MNPHPTDTDNVHIEVRLDSQIRTPLEQSQWQSNDVLPLTDLDNALFDIYANDQLYGKGKLVEHEGYYAIEIISLSK